MQAKLTNRPVEQVIAAIQALDVESVKLRMMDSELGDNWPREYADSIEVAYKNYLSMLVKYPEEAESIVLSKDVDEFWHTHILQTIKYAEDCQRMFGNFLHHTPHFGPRTEADLAQKAELTERTRQLYRKEFGDNHRDEAAWAGDLVDSKMAPRFQPQAAAWSMASIKAENTAWSMASIQTQNTAWSMASIQPQNTAWSMASIQTQNTAWSMASIQGNAKSGRPAVIDATNAAWSMASIGQQQPEKANAEIQVRNTAWSMASIKPQNTAWSMASIQPQNTAWSMASIKSAEEGSEAEHSA